MSTQAETATPYVYVLVRADLSPAQQAVQACHAALEAGFSFKAPTSPANLVLLEVPDQNALLSYAGRLAKQGIEHVVFHEPDDGIGESALATGALTDRRDRRLFSGLQLARRPQET